MYEAGLPYTRTHAERADALLAWEREDRAFFASGACHILAHQFVSLHLGEGYDIVYIRPRGTMTGSHMYASNGEWAFDFNGWTRETELLDSHATAYRNLDPDWDYDWIVLTEGLPEFLKRTNDLRPPEYFPELPWRRAHAYIDRFDAHPPGEGSSDATAGHGEATDAAGAARERRLLVIVSGAPGSGKTTLASALSARLSLPLLSKDTIKEALMRVLDVVDVASSQRIGAAAVESLFALADDSHGAVLESVWRPGLARPQLTALQGHKIEVFCDCPGEVARDRCRHRAAKRAAGHFDHERAATDDLWVGDTAQPTGGAWPVVCVNTDGPVDLDDVVNGIEASYARQRAT